MGVREPIINTTENCNLLVCVYQHVQMPLNGNVRIILSHVKFHRKWEMSVAREKQNATLRVEPTI